MERVMLFNEKVVLVDEEDLENIKKHKWSFDGRYAYRKERINTLDGLKIRKIFMHREINKTPPGMDTDHINGNKLDNRKSNLRTATRGQNNANIPKIVRPCSSKHKGVCWHSHTKKWRAEIKVNGVKKYLGVYGKEEDAAIAYNNAAKIAFGDYSKQNDL